MSLLALGLRLVLAMAAVVAVMWFAARTLQRHRSNPRLRPGPAPVIEVVGRRGFGRSSSVAVVQAAGRTLILGVTETNVTLLAEGDPPLDPPEPTAQRMGHLPGALASPPARTPLLESLRERTVRR